MSTNKLTASVEALRPALESLVEVEAIRQDDGIWQVTANLWEDGEIRVASTRQIAGIAVKGYMDRIRREYRGRAAHRIALMEGFWSPIYPF